MALPELVSALASTPAGTPLDLAALKSVLPQPMSPLVTAAYCALIAARQDETGVPDLLALLPSELPVRYSSDLAPLDALLAFDSPAVWERTWDEVLRLYAAHQLDQQRYEIMIGRIGSQSEHPDRVLCAHRETRAGKPFERERQALSARKADLVRLRRSDPERYLAEMEGYLAELRALADRYAEYAFSAGLRDEIAKETMWLADFARFTLRQPQKAIALYEQVAPVDGWASIRPLVRFLIGDIHQFDLADPTGAIAAYLGALAEIDAVRSRRHNDDGAALYAWWESWLEHEIAFLARGERFRGTVPSEALGGFMLNVGILLPTSGAGPQDASPWATLWPEGRGGRPDPDAFDRLPPSHMTLARMLPAVSLLPDADHIVRFLDRNDPGGYWVGSFVALTQLAARASAAGPDRDGAWEFRLGSVGLEPMSGERPSPIAVAVQRLARGRGIGLTPPDPRLESPEATWALFLAALRAGDVESAVACFTVDRRPGMRAWLSRLSKDELRALADSHTGFAMTEPKSGPYSEAAIARQSSHGKVLGFAYFINQGGEWRVEEGP
jgi:hypothetical protein